eukprot:TRINITY_DN3129_c0_g2_i1.p1 TRINITY_DN3129_c0_g2~~TRINITY_DN3129_c0_g2_i1.p1  ORF type:complete len:373 (-),score=71.15 TRINITY_DN3129_c0_g2_i1:978-2096(-)
MLSGLAARGSVFISCMLISLFLHPPPVSVPLSSTPLLAASYDWQTPDVSPSQTRDLFLPIFELPKRTPDNTVRTVHDIPCEAITTSDNFNNIVEEEEEPYLDLVANESFYFEEQFADVRKVTQPFFPSEEFDYNSLKALSSHYISAFGLNFIIGLVMEMAVFAFFFGWNSLRQRKIEASATENLQIQAQFQSKIEELSSSFSAEKDYVRQLLKQIESQNAAKERMDKSLAALQVENEQQRRQLRKIIEAKDNERVNFEISLKKTELLTKRIAERLKEEYQMEAHIKNSLQYLQSEKLARQQALEIADKSVRLQNEIKIQLDKAIDRFNEEKGRADSLEERLKVAEERLLTEEKLNRELKAKLGNFRTNLRII